MQVRSLSWKDLLEKEMATCSSILAWRIPWREERESHGEATVHGVAKSQTRLKQLSTQVHIFLCVAVHLKICSESIKNK